MDAFGPYKIIEQITETLHSTSYRVRYLSDENNPTAVLKIFKIHLPSPSDIARFNYENQLIRRLDFDGIVKVLDIINHNETLAVVMEDFDNRSLKEYIRQTKFGIEEFLRIAITLADILGHLHLKNIIHKDVKPANILYNRTHFQVKLTDFGIMDELTHLDEALYNPDYIEGTLYYVSPEKTGRLNCPIDYRTDLYSLGITFYEILTGTLPFISNDPIRIIHAHIAKRPVSPHEFNTDIPRVISDIIMKLLEKNAESRYQNSFGLKSDLENCYQLLQEKGEIAGFELARKDISLKFNIPQEIVGRQEEINKLLNHYAAVCQGARQLLLVTGDPGVGKSAVINQIQKPVLESHGFFISGKYDQFRQDVPYSAIIRAFQGLIRQILTENKERILEWKIALLEALKENGGVIIRIIPEVELLIGLQPEIPLLEPEETQNRFFLVFKNFIRVFAGKTHPLVLFLDDLQWADIASFHLISQMLSYTDVNYFLIVGSYRSNEISLQHPLELTLKEIANRGNKIDTIMVNPLGKKAVNQIIARFLRINEETTIELSELIYYKTNGNPFFINQFLKKLFSEKIINLNPDKGWDYNLEKIKNVQETGNVVELMAAKIALLPESTREILKISSCIGNRFELEKLALVYRKSIEEILIDLNIAIQEGLVSPSGSMYIFHHDRIQEAAYSLIPETERCRLHYQIGRLFLSNTPEVSLMDHIFYIVNHLNYGIHLISDSDERQTLCILNFNAGERAKASNAYESAVKYFRIATELLLDNCWQSHYEITLSLFRERIECEFHTTNIFEAERLVQIVIKNCRNKLDKISIYSQLVLIYSYSGKYQKAVELGIKTLKKLGYHLSLNPGRLGFMMDILKIKFFMRHKSVDDIYQLPLMRDPEKQVLLQLFYAISIPAINLNSNLVLKIVFRSILLFLKYGNYEYADWAWMFFSGMVGRILGDYRKADEISQMALRLNKKHNNKKFRCKTLLTYVLFVAHWTRPKNELIRYVEEAYEAGLENGDLTFASHAANMIYIFSMLTGTNIETCYQNYLKYEPFIKSFNAKITVGNFNTNIHLMMNLLGKTKNRSSFDTDNFNEEEFFKQYQKQNDNLFLYFYFMAKIIINYLNGYYPEGLALIHRIKDIALSSVGIYDEPYYYFFYSLILTALYPQITNKEKREYSKQLQYNLKLMKNWAENGPVNFKHKYLLIKAEFDRITVPGKKNNFSIIEYYQQGIKLAADHQYLLDEALGNELLARFFLQNGQEEIAGMYMNRSYSLYLRWGAVIKAEELKEKYPLLLKLEDIKTANPDHTAKEVSVAATNRLLDINSIIKTTQALSGEIEMSRILQKFVSIMLENSGAEKGMVILINNNELYIEAEGHVMNGIISMLQSIPVNDDSELCLPAIRYALITKENVVLNNASTEGMFIQDPYIIRRNIKSLLCIPVIKQQKVIGVLYLENNLATHVFTPERIELLNMISTQVAISIENAQLIERSKEQERLKQEMEIARKIQISILPKIFQYEELDIAAQMLSLDVVGGDYYDILLDPKKNVWFAIGDVSGHGIMPGLIMIMAETAFIMSIMLHQDQYPKDAINSINLALYENIQNRLKASYYMTLCLIKYEGNGRFLYAGAHVVIIIYRADTGMCEEIDTNGIFLGMAPNISEFSVDKHFSLALNDLVVFYTDGLIEVRDKEGQEFDIRGIKKVLTDHPGKSAEEIKMLLIESVMKWCDNKPDDDITLIVVRRKR